MTREEAISGLKYAQAMCEFNPSTGEVGFRNDEDRKQHEAFGMAIEALQAESAKHGEWETGLLREFRDTNIEAQEEADKAGYVRYVVNLKCSACGKITMVDNSIKYNFCPNCGAKMDG